ncbi:MAG TPA: DNA mismatch repair protein MutS [Thermotogota bacterium]|nr:DNA mismatch repair protein MutS [Thermotogota bacterium]
MSEKKLTPMMQQYMDIKSLYLDAILLFRLGDFYEAFFEDAKRISRVLQLVLTHRNGNDMAGIPYHALNNYLKKLVEAGFKVAICDQVEDPKQATGIVRREVTRVVTPGTVIEDSILQETTNSYMASVMKSPSAYFCVLLDISTGSSMVFQRKTWNELEDIVKKFGTVQLLYPEGFEDEHAIRQLKKQMRGLYIEALPKWYYNHDEAVNQLQRVFEVGDISFLELPADACALYGATLKYLDYQHMDAFEHLSRPVYMNDQKRLLIDNTTVENLDLIGDTKEKQSGCLFNVIDRTLTSLGKRKLKEWLLSPLKNLEEITSRLDHVRQLVVNEWLISCLEKALDEVYDIERIISRLSYKKVTPADFCSLRSTLQVIPQIIEFLADEPVFGDINGQLDPVEELKALLNRALYDEPESQIGLGKTIREGFDEELDEYRELLTGGSKKLRELEDYERQRTGISTLKIRQNKVFGYYIEISKAHSAKIPDDYERKQTLVSSERYISDALKPIEEKLTMASERVDTLEHEAYRRLMEQSLAFIPRLKENAHALACLDGFVSLAKIAVEKNYSEPVFNRERRVHIQGGRHPVVECFEDNFIPNDISLDQNGSFIILTGPNMSGKSTYLRQTALICLMAQMGSFVPATKANLPILDRIFTRIGARDDLSSGKSTFLVEMSETATILNNATSDSLVILDEVGRGTSTYDGISIAWVVSEYLHNTIGSYTIFATHYNELTELANLYDGMKNMCVKVLEEDNAVVFLHKVEAGISSKSYGIEVAKIAGLPKEVVQRAHEVLDTITEEKNLEGKVRVLGFKQMDEIRKKSQKTKKMKQRKTQQLSFFMRGDSN